MTTDPHTLYTLATLDHKERLTWTKRQRLSDQAVRPFSGSAIARAATRRLGGALIRVGGRLEQASIGETTVPSSTAASLGPAR
jgi:hypothetical protein